MVRVIDGYKARLEAAHMYETMYKLTKQLFGNRVASKMPIKRVIREGLSEIIVRDGPKVAVYISPNSGFVEVNNEADFDKAFQLANRGEDLVCKEFVIKTNYQRS